MTSEETPTVETIITEINSLIDSTNSAIQLHNEPETQKNLQRVVRDLEYVRENIHTITEDDVMSLLESTLRDLNARHPKFEIVK